jgi:hypothetical protein
LPAKPPVVPARKSRNEEETMALDDDDEVASDMVVTDSGVGIRETMERREVINRPLLIRLVLYQSGHNVDE